MEVIAIILEQLLSELIGQGIKYIIRKTVDALGNTVTEILYKYDSDGDGIEDAEQVIYTLDTLIPDMSEGYAIVNQGDEIGIGLPQYELIDSVDMADRLIDTVTGNNNGYLIGDDVYVPLPFDFSGDGLTDWDRVVDDGYDQIVKNISSGSGKSIIIVSPDGTTCVYDENGNITEQDCETAYQIWVSDNNIMSKPLDYYTPTEGLLLLTFVVSLFGFFGNIFRRRRVM